MKFNSSGSPVTTFQQQFATALSNATTTNGAYKKPLEGTSIEVSANGAVWTLDSTNEQLVGVSNVGLPSASISFDKFWTFQFRMIGRCRQLGGSRADLQALQRRES